MRPFVPPDIADDDLASTPIARAWTIPSAWYLDPQFHAFDREVIFARSWQCVGHAVQLSDPGMFITATVAETPVIVLRDKQGTLRAFHNVCRHRGGPLATEPSGCVNALTCQYHGWTYLLDGSLRGVPKWDRVELFDKKDFGLVPLHVSEWEGQVFVHLGDAPAPLADAMQGIAERIAPLRIGDLTFTHRVDYIAECNWKVYVDNFLEGYHVPYVHPELMKLYDFKRYTTELAERYSLQWSPLAPGDAPYGIGEGDCAFYFFVFPNFMMNLLPGRLQTNVVVPMGPDRCRVEFRYFHARVEGAEAQRLIEEDVAYSDRVQREDLDICAHVQKGIASRAYERGRFSVETEQCVHHFQEMLRGAYRSGVAR